jgi:hypothetical protein
MAYPPTSVGHANFYCSRSDGNSRSQRCKFQLFRGEHKCERFVAAVLFQACAAYPRHSGCAAVESNMGVVSKGSYLPSDATVTVFFKIPSISALLKEK